MESFVFWNLIFPGFALTLASSVVFFWDRSLSLKMLLIVLTCAFFVLLSFGSHALFIYLHFSPQVKAEICIAWAVCN
jgi:hypothetical protein